MIASIAIHQNLKEIYQKLRHIKRKNTETILILLFMNKISLASFYLV